MDSLKIVAVLAAAGAVGFAAWRIRGTTKGEEPTPVATAPQGEYQPPERRSARELPWRMASPPPLPSGSSLLLADGTPDELALRVLLVERRFDELNRFIEGLEDAAEADVHREKTPIAALQAFDASDASIGMLVDAWVEATPRSFAPWTARGLRTSARATSARGTGAASTIKAEQFAEMARLHAAARADLDEALRLRPRLIAAYGELVAIAGMTSDDAAGVAAYEAGVKACPACVTVRRRRLHYLTPRWGGSAARMAEEVAAAQPYLQANPALAVLAGVADNDACSETNLGACDRAVATGDDEPFFEHRAIANLRKGDVGQALASAERAGELAPNSSSTLALRAMLRSLNGHWDGAADDLRRAWLLDPLLRDTQRRAREVVARMVSAAAKEPRLAELAVELDANSAAALRARGRAALAAGQTDDAQRDAEAAVALDPGDYASCVLFDDVMVKRRAMAPIVPVWDRFLALEPDDARGWAQRAGTLHHLRREEEARADLHHACELGLGRACQLEQRVTARP